MPNKEELDLLELLELAPAIANSNIIQLLAIRKAIRKKAKWVQKRSGMKAHYHI